MRSSSVLFFSCNNRRFSNCDYKRGGSCHIILAKSYWINSVVEFAKYVRCDGQIRGCIIDRTQLLGFQSVIQSTSLGLYFVLDAYSQMIFTKNGTIFVARGVSIDIFVFVFVSLLFFREMNECLNEPHIKNSYISTWPCVVWLSYNDGIN